MRKLPTLQKDEKGIWSLMVDGTPYFGLGGELHNSASSDVQYLENKVWPAVKKLGINTVIAPIYWELLEPTENEFDFTHLESLLTQARKADVKLILLWFGLWKNGESFYVPSWVLRDTERFFRVESTCGNPIMTVSPFCTEAVAADKKAFTALMQTLRALDEQDQTVILVQVENEIGVLGAERDFCMQAECAYQQPIPACVQQRFDKKGSWHQAFGEEAPEYFMSYYYATAVEQIAAAGKAMYPLPMYVNAWLKQFPERPGIYPCGGPTADMIPIWQLAAPSIDLCAPDIYLSDFTEVCDAYTKYDNPLLIPEARRDPSSASNVFYAFGKYHTICFAPFAVEDFFDEQDVMPDETLLKQLNILAAAFCPAQTAKYLPTSYHLLASVKELYLAARGTDRLHPFIKQNDHQSGTILSLRQADLQLTFQSTEYGKPGTAGMVIEVDEHTFYILGTNVSFSLLPKRASHTVVEMERLEKGEFKNGLWSTQMILNGDERMQTVLHELAEIRKVTYHAFNRKGI